VVLNGVLPSGSFQFNFPGAFPLFAVAASTAQHVLHVLHVHACTMHSKMNINAHKCMNVQFWIMMIYICYYLLAIAEAQKRKRGAWCLLLEKEQLMKGGDRRSKSCSDKD
jgi:hypothetical protein